jgi:hypothetical protein
MLLCAFNYNHACRSMRQKKVVGNPPDGRRCICNHGDMNKPGPIKEMISDCLAVRVRLLARSVSAIYDQAVASHDVTIAQVNLLTALGGVGRCAPVSLAKFCSWSDQP